MHAQRLVSALLAAALLLVACGQKPGVHVEAGPTAVGADPGEPQPSTSDPGGATPERSDAPEHDDASAPPSPEEGAPRSTEDGGAAGDGVVRDDAAGEAGGEASTDDAGASTGDEAAADTSAETREPQGSDRTGVTDDTITLSFHAPVTGAAPLPATVFRDASDLYWRWVQEEQGEQVLDRRVQVAFRDDRYEPTTARQVCRELMADAFALAGAGADGIAACGQLAGQMRVPYLPIGGGEVGLDTNPWVFGLVQSYDQQGPALARLVAERLDGRRAAAVATDTNNFDGGVASWEAGLEQHGVDHVPSLRHPRGDTTWYSGYANRLAEQGVEVVYMMTSPLDWIRFAQVASEQGHDFHYLTFAPGGLNAVLQNGCPALGDATALSGWPGLDAVDDVDPDFRRAVDRFGISDTNLDLALAVWGASKMQHRMLERYEETFGTDLTREDFRALVESSEIPGDVFSDLSFAPDRRFGAQDIFVLEADCDAEQWRHAGRG